MDSDSQPNLCHLHATLLQQGGQRQTQIHQPHNGQNPRNGQSRKGMYHSGSCKRSKQGLEGLNMFAFFAAYPFKRKSTAE